MKFFYLLFNFTFLLTACSNPQINENEGSNQVDTNHTKTVSVKPVKTVTDNDSSLVMDTNYTHPLQIFVASELGNNFHIDYPRKVYKDNEFIIWHIHYSLIPCAAVCPNFETYIVTTIGDTNTITDQMDFTSDYIREVKTKVDDGILQVDSVVYETMEEEGPSGLPETGEIISKGTCQYHLTRKGKFVLLDLD